MGVQGFALKMLGTAGHGPDLRGEHAEPWGLLNNPNGEITSSLAPIRRGGPGLTPRNGPCLAALSSPKPPQGDSMGIPTFIFGLWLLNGPRFA